MSQPLKTCILLVNLGTPDAPTAGAVGRYLREFLGDGRVIDIPWLPRKILVNGIIAPIRRFRSAREYKKVWTDEGSPLLLYGEALQRDLQARLITDEAQKAFGGEVVVELAMRYQNPSMDRVMARM
ncbi:MAG: ferrochelatase, partial [Bacteroidetes bacterium]|nr:ferrochelatase [Bacteroidota bacterium]